LQQAGFDIRRQIAGLAGFGAADRAAASGFGRGKVSASGVTILLSTFNGEPYLPAQLDSIRNQTHADWRLAWRDDGSSDNSVAAVEAFSTTLAIGQCARSPSSGTHLGAEGSFLQLLSENAGSPFIAFSDQDDRWLPDKLQRAVARLGGCDRPALYCARQMLTDDDFSHPRLSVKFEARPGFPASLTQNIATGNTIVMNHAAARLVASMPAPAASPHDWWSYIVVSACGGQVIYDPEPAVLYRQHMKNMIGAQLPTITRAIAALERGGGIYMTMMRRHAEQLHACRDRLSPAARDDLDMIRKGLAGGFSDRLAALRRPDFKRATALENLLFRIWFLTQSGQEESSDS
jgi:glycosyltransferase involved in cell wall biosynthesis